MSEPDKVPEIMRILRRFETANNSVGPASTHIWLLPYLPYVGEKVLMTHSKQINYVGTRKY